MAYASSEILTSLGFQLGSKDFRGVATQQSRRDWDLRRYANQGPVTEEGANEYFLCHSLRKTGGGDLTYFYKILRQ